MPTAKNIINWSGDQWQIISAGTKKDDLIYVHLASLTRYHQQRNGAKPIQICDWLPVEIIDGQVAA